MTTKYFKMILFIFTLLFIYSDSIAQPMEFERAKQRVITMKKIKVLEVLNLSDEKSEQFLVRYNSAENKIFEISKNIDAATSELHQLLSGKTAKSGEIKTKSDDIMKMQNQLHAAIEEKYNTVKNVLNEEEFAKYIIFERQFNQQLRRHMSRPRHGGGDPDEPMRGRRSRQQD